MPNFGGALVSNQTSFSSRERFELINYSNTLKLSLSSETCSTEKTRDVGRERLCCGYVPTRREGGIAVGPNRQTSDGMVLLGGYFMQNLVLQAVIR